VAIPFVKMHGLGNDYVYVDGTAVEITDPPALARVVSDRHRGIGSDGLVLVRPSRVAAVQMRMWNADGSESAMCGNALRCVARLAVDRGWVGERSFSIETKERLNEAHVLEEGMVRVSLGEPIFERGRLPMLGPPAARVIDEPLEVDGDVLQASAVSMGNPHLILEVGDVSQAPVTVLGPRLERDPRFPERINVEFIEVVSRHRMRMRVWERGSGETQACGSGAAASMVTATLRGRVESPVDVELLGGTLRVEWQRGGPVWITGPATYAFEGVWLGAEVGAPAATRSQ
jgi:diaminopimelate epimerase